MREAAARTGCARGAEREMDAKAAANHSPCVGEPQGPAAGRRQTAEVKLLAGRPDVPSASGTTAVHNSLTGQACRRPAGCGGTEQRGGGSLCGGAQRDRRKPATRAPAGHRQSGRRVGRAAAQLARCGALSRLAPLRRCRGATVGLGPDGAQRWRAAASGGTAGGPRWDTAVAVRTWRRTMATAEAARRCGTRAPRPRRVRTTRNPDRRGAVLATWRMMARMGRCEQRVSV